MHQGSAEALKIIAKLFISEEVHLFETITGVSQQQQKKAATLVQMFQQIRSSGELKHDKRGTF